MQETTRRRGVAAALAAGIVGAFYIGKLPAALPALKAEFSLSLVAASWVVSTFNALAVFAAPLFGLASDRVGAVRFTLFGLAAMAAGGALGALAPNETVLLASRFVEGAGFIAVVVGAPALLVAATAATRRKTILGVWSAYMPFGGSLVMLAAPFALALWGWRGLWLAIALLTVAAAAAILAARSDYAGIRSVGPRPIGAVLEPLKRPGPWWLALAFAFYTAQFSTVMVFLPTFLVERGVPLGTAALMTACYVAINVPGNLAGTWLLHRGVPRGGLIAATAAAMGVCAALALLPLLPDAARYAATLALSCVGGMIPAAVLSGSPVHARSPAETGGIQGLFVQGANLGQFVGPPAAAAAVSSAGNWVAALAVLGTAAALAIVAGLMAARHEPGAGDAR
ncbi:MAG: MFS transporter [Burkholderiales bacterium]|jgi:predicted MFS family arabinose efflux permease|nr:MFS transporter [Burkholderiales bacterium]